ncbi:NADH-quinone oxidoreductase subunit L [Rhodovulum sulfidophilum]|uniref:NADH-quinone oxidoreductase subunit L n=1 Tax=Rhodovulum sulfidophilum TaxID=35806 RepID=UPI0005AA7811|nr:NADH-quinone oxidoreductase subunit L [Rhodovulum sulfidophilum]ANB35342.1 NADH-quinone oxidoreductase subunit L [Rhodovulum sulfidophilum DSM 1374]ANB39164.1 NADH-quinone oxidoreductase subunit L [Rhodovulum sulfidophilum]MCW2303824.1 NADH-quinone oxidoreductase subunit L [Rhodovulum sulfidophilum]
MEKIILFAPLIGALLCGFGYRMFGEKAAMWITTAMVFLSMLFSWVVFTGFDGEMRQVEIFRWIDSGSLVADWSIRIDRLTAIMLIVVTTVSAFVHLYSFGYMAHDPEWREGESYKPRFFAYLSFFTFTMLALVTADNLVQLFFGWEGVGVASYLLIGFYYRKPSANAAAIKAFVVNRVGDFGFLLAMASLFFLLDSVSFDDIFDKAPELATTQLSFLSGSWSAANVVGVLLFIGAMGKSAQLFLHTWLPDAMEGPTPVSALIHAATMVTAGVFLVCRMSPVLEFAPDAKAMIVFIGALTAFFAATIGLVQNDIKRVIAYSTCSQLGYMFVAAGVGVYSAAMFHLLTHAFFKALLFLGAGSVIHAMHHEQDMRNYGGLRTKIPYTFGAMMIGTLAITGVGIPLTHIGFAGFLSKDAIIESAWGGGANLAFWMLVIAAAFTSFYSWRLIFLTFFGKARGDKHAHEHAHESPWTMLVPLGVLSVGAVLAGMLWYGDFFGDHDKVNRFYGVPSHEVAAAAGEHGGTAAEGAAALPGQGAIYTAPDNHAMENAHEAPKWVKASPFLAMLGGFAVAWLFYISSPELPARTARAARPLYLFLLNKWYFDELYDAIIVQPARNIGRALWKGGDGGIIDGGINGVAMGIVPFFTRLAGRLQSGYVYHYAFAMVIGIAVLVTWMALTGGAQ